MKIVKCRNDYYPALIEIWERSVRATHDFLTDDVINDIKSALIPDYFPNVDLYAIMDCGPIIGFIGLPSDTIEMLFIDSNSMGKGYGTALIDFAKKRGATRVDVNEHNVRALEFYKAKGFHIIARDEKDEAGRPYPILHLLLG